MDNRLYLIDLYDIYGNTLTEKQQEYFEDYYFNNYSLSEISENYNVSRNAIHKNIKDSENKLIYLENILKVYDNNKRIKEIIKNSNLEDEITKIIEE